MNMKNILLALVLMVTTISMNLSAQDNLWYDKPARLWHEALPLGNGHVGAMVYGGVAHEQLDLNEGTFWNGGPHSNNSNEALEYLPQVRQLIFDGREEEAQRLVDKHFIKGPHGMSFLTLGSLRIAFDGIDDGAIADYRRELDLTTATHTVSFSAGGVKYRRTTYASLADNVIVVHLTSEGGTMGISITQDCPLPIDVTASADDLTATIKGGNQEGVEGRLTAVCRTKVLRCDGQSSTDDAHSKLCVKAATDIVLLVSAATNYVNYHDTSADPFARVKASLMAASAYDELHLALRHKEAYREQYDRVSITLDSSDRSMQPTDQRLRQFNGTDLGLVTTLFNYGRYLLISSSQPGGQPANLQGIWNNSTTPAWDSKYTININTEMNYWPAEVTGLVETAEPLFDLIRDLSVTGAETARTMYGCKGWMAHHNTDLWRIAGPVDGANWGMFPNGGAWLATHLWQHYLYSGDKAFLRRWYPIMKGTADFYIDYMQEHPSYGWLVSVPSVSPEQGPMGKRTAITAGCTMDNQIAFDALNNTLQAARILDVDSLYQKTLQVTISQLPPMQIGRHRQLQEWLWDGDDPNNQHRHISHLYGLYPSNQISPYRTPELFEAARTTLTQRGDEATGWSLGWKVNFWARMLDGDHAYTILSNLLKILPSDRDTRNYPAGRMYPNLFDAHPPFQIDGNFGAAAGIAELFLQSHDGAVHLLPALPTAMSKGVVKGLRARGGFVIDESFSRHRLLEATIHSTIGGTIRLRSYVPLGGEGLREAHGACPNTLLEGPDVKAPLVSKAIGKAPTPHLPAVYEYDLDTEAGHTYTIHTMMPY